MKKLDTQSPDFQDELKALLAFETAQNPEIDRIVADICADVQKRGDAALIEYTNRFDGTSAQTIDDLILTQDDLQSAFERLPENIQTALKTAARRVESYHKHQKMADPCFCASPRVSTKADEARRARPALRLPPRCPHGWSVLRGISEDADGYPSGR